MKKITKALLALTLSLLMLAAPISVNQLYANENILTEVTSDTINNYTYYEYDSEADGYTSKRSNILTPIYYIFAGKQDLTSADKLIEETGLLDNVHEWAGKVYIINPISTQYNNDDVTAFKKLAGTGVSNIKVIGIDEGATFVNNYISQNCYFIAGMMVYGGTMNSDLTYNVPIPAYLSSTATSAVSYYKQANQTDQSQSFNNYTIYQNSTNPLQIVVNSKTDETLKNAFDNAWETVFSKNYRQHNETTEFYNMPVTDTNLANAEQPYKLIETPIFDRLGIIHNQEINQTVSNMPGKYTWFEYLPNQVIDTKKDSVPLVLTLHGNGNDPRVQADSSGWIELAAKENFIVVSPEWQDASVNFSKCDGLGDEGIINLIDDLKIKYPQIDRSRVYVTGLSAGGAESLLLGVKNSETFAGVGAVSGVNLYSEAITELTNDYKGHETPLLYICGDHDFFQMIPVDGSSQYGTSQLYGFSIWAEDSNTHIYSALQAYQKINDLTVTDMNMDLNPYYGIKLDNQQWTKLGEKDMYTGTLSNNNGVVMELAAIKDHAHWNYKPEAQYIWNFFKNYQRDLLTGELIFVNNGSNTTTVIDKKDDLTTSVKTGDEVEFEYLGILSVITITTFIYFKKKIA